MTGSIQVQATVLEAVGQYEISSTSINIPFIPAFHVITSELHVSGMHPHTMLKVSANDRVIQELQVIECFIVSRYCNLFSKSFYLDTRHLMQINYLLVSVLTAIFYLCLASCEPVSPSFSFLRLFQNKTIVNKWYCFLPF